MPGTREDLLRLLDDALDGATANALTLREALRAAEKEVSELIKFGSVQSVNKNSAGQSYAQSAIGVLTAAEVARLWRELLTLHYNSRLAFIASGQSDPSDADIYAEMVARLNKNAHVSRLDLTNLRCVA